MKSTGSYWRDRLRPIVTKAFNDCEGCDKKALRKHLKPLFPYGERRGWPYKVWLDEIRLQLGKPKKQKKVAPQGDVQGQLSLLDLHTTSPG
jgi:hypothetical protein